MGAKISKPCSSLKSLLNLFKLFLKFLLGVPHKSTVLWFWNFEFPDFCFVNIWDPMGAKISKRYSSRKSLLYLFKLFIRLFFFSDPHKSTVMDSWNFEFKIFHIFFFFFINMGLYGSQTFKMLLLSQITLESFQTFSWIFPVFLTKVLFCIFEILSFRLLVLFDYVSRADEIENSRSSVVRVGVMSDPIEQIPFKFHLWLPLGHTSKHFFF